ncbi:tumor necrosis factor ligand superfamily member 13 isoform X2 [Electrophorus electricus]|uniref:tumor necrosis factor ligand superfamily member 13 isoform X2 n=1 Tax=Electrophorus electricus TaxID=8005 RepID=UPI0015D00793|nr:tumor necrosis factor ligand superfamily member 13 isoform X2 [Electrophorus electricus]
MQKSLILCTVIISLACVCVAVLAVQWRRIQTLRLELLNLEQHVMSLTGSCGERGTYPYTTACCGVSLTHPLRNSRKKRGASSKQNPRRKRQKQRTFVHLVPASIHSYDERDLTVLTWALGQSYGAGLQLSGETITVVNNGTYFIYSQVLYKDTTWVMGHVITKRINGAETKLMKCLKSMPRNVSLPLNSCYTAGAHFLESGSVLELSVPRKSADLILSAQATFMGIFSI